MPITNMCRHQSDDSMSQSFKNKAYDFGNGGHFKNGLQNGGYNGMIYPAIVFFLKSTPQKTYIESTMIALRLLVSEIVR